MNHEIDSLNRKIEIKIDSTEDQNGDSPVFLESSHVNSRSEIELTELLVTESHPVTKRLN